MKELILLIAAVLIAGLCIGVLSACARVPHPRLLSTISATVLVVLAALTLFVLDPSNLWLALSFVALVVLSSAAYSTVLWSRELAEAAPSMGTLFMQVLFRPAYVRDTYAALRSESVSSLPRE